MIVALAVAAVILIGGGTGQPGPVEEQGAQEPSAQEPSSQESTTPKTEIQEGSVDEEAPPENGNEQASGNPGQGEEPEETGKLDSPALGEPDAPVVLVEYSDYQ